MFWQPVLDVIQQEAAHLQLHDLILPGITVGEDVEAQDGRGNAVCQCFPAFLQISHGKQQEKKKER